MTPNMVPFAFLGALALLSAFVVQIMLRRGVLDHPGARSSHSQPTPKGGGVGIVTAFLVGVTAVLLSGGGRLPTVPTCGLLVATLVIAVVSYLDDVKDWPFLIKLAAQTGAACLVIACGIRLGGIRTTGLAGAGGDWIATLLTLAWIVLVTNAVNFIDGLNGLASGCVGLACLFLMPWAGHARDMLLLACSLALAGGITGFLPFNFPRARIFMGDVGSQPCGFVIACLGILVASEPGRSGSLLAVPAMLSGIIFDVLFTLGRRLVNGDRLTQAHRSHLYQIAHRAGRPASLVSPAYWLFTIWGGVWALTYAASNGMPTAGQITLLFAPEIAWLGLTVLWSSRAHINRW